MPRLLPWLAVLLASAGCARRVQVWTPDRPLQAGVRLALPQVPGDTLSWDFGDGTPPERTASPAHAWAQAGRYQVVGRDGEQVAWRAELEVVPRPALAAVPRSAVGALCSPGQGETLARAVDFLERVLGAGQLSGWLEQSLLPALVLELGAEGNGGFDAKEGVGVFALASVQGRVAFAGVRDDAQALAQLLNRLRERGADVAEATADGVRIATFADGTPVVAFVDRGYLYAVLPESPLDAARAVAEVRRADDEGLSAHTPPGDGELLWVFGPEDEDATWQLAVGEVQLDKDQAALTGRVFAKQPLWAGQAAVPLFASAPAGPVLAAAFGVAPETLATLLLGRPGSPRREKLGERLAKGGVELERSLAAFSGEAGVLAYFDAEAFLRNLVAGSQKPEPRGGVVAEAGVRDDKALVASVTQLLATMAPSVLPRTVDQGTAWRGTWKGEPFELLLSSRALRLSGGSGVEGRPVVDVGRGLGARHGGAFAPGHVSLLVDVGQLRRELEVPRLIAGLDPARVVTVQGFAAAFLDQLTPVETLLLDLAPDARGAQVRGRLTLKSR